MNEKYKSKEFINFFTHLLGVMLLICFVVSCILSIILFNPWIFVISSVIFIVCVIAPIIISIIYEVGKDFRHEYKTFKNEWER